jgi:parallel beta-helix repeat protein
VHDTGQGLIEETEIFADASWGITSCSGAIPVVRNNRITKNGSVGVRVYENGGGTFENNDLTENPKGAWSISEDSEANVKRINNKE